MARAWSNVEPNVKRELESFVLVLDRIAIDLQIHQPHVPLTTKEREAAAKQVKLLRKVYQSALRGME